MKKLSLLIVLVLFSTLFISCWDEPADPTDPPRDKIPCASGAEFFIADIEELTVNVFAPDIPIDYSDTSLRFYVDGSNAVLLGNDIPGMLGGFAFAYVCNLPEGIINDEDIAEGISVTLSGKLYQATYIHPNVYLYTTLELSSISINEKHETNDGDIK